MSDLLCNYRLFDRQMRLCCNIGNVRKRCNKQRIRVLSSYVQQFIHTEE